MAVLLIVVIFIVVLGIQALVASHSNWHCGKCGTTFSLSPLKAALLPNRWGGQKLAKCPRCGVRSWAHRVPKET